MSKPANRERTKARAEREWAETRARLIEVSRILTDVAYAARTIDASDMRDLGYIARSLRLASDLTDSVIFGTPDPRKEGYPHE